MLTYADVCWQIFNEGYQLENGKVLNDFRKKAVREFIASQTFTYRKAGYVFRR